MELANRFYESGLFQNAVPDLMEDITSTCADDTYFEDQWGLKNTGQYGGISGIDIKACDAWQISTGNNVVAAIVDQGVVLNHPDALKDNLYGIKIDALNYQQLCKNIFSALKENYFNGIIVAVMGEEGEGAKGRKGEEEKAENSPSNIEGVDGEAGRGSLSALSACHNITLVPNPTAGELRMEN
jgi:hypothetical protein